jgi:hypothetical protein
MGMNDIAESDWKRLRSFKDRVLDRACQGILDQVSKILQGGDGEGAYSKYGRILEAMAQGRDGISTMCDDFRRSSAIRQLTLWKFNGLITDEEMESLTPETRETVDKLLSLKRR